MELANLFYGAFQFFTPSTAPLIIYYVQDLQEVRKTSSESRKMETELGKAHVGKIKQGS